MDRSIEFYRDVLGARFIARFDPPGMHSSRSVPHEFCWKVR